MTAKKRTLSSTENLEHAMKTVKISQPTTPDHEIPTACNAGVDNSSIEMQEVQRFPNPGGSLQAEAEMTTNCNHSAAEELENNKDEMEISEPSTPQFVIPETCKAGVVVNRGENYSIKIENVKVPEPGPDEVLIKIDLFRVCSGDIHCLKGMPGLIHNPNNGVKSAGHEGVGRVVKIGSHLKDIKIGARVAIGLLWRYNSRGTNHRRGERQSMLLTGVDVPGTFQRYITLPEKSMILIPEGVTDETAACVICCGGPIYKAFSRWAHNEGDWALIAAGSPAQNILAAQIAKAKGFKAIVLADHSQKDLCLKMGVEHFMDEETDWAGEVEKLTGGHDKYMLFPMNARGLRDCYPPDIRPGDTVSPAYLRKCTPFKYLV
ncbi:hypothetical protein EMPG_16577 [Blastomyces silverae]|uniref:Uncharacterized protein n=1 Tax=Blastomyces silverae TaxID=2060906 RepID=A0A0H1B992_9EURO|nr:hypothetical protein EMPG_16577 [Blastomyces silverae]